MNKLHVVTLDSGGSAVARDMKVWLDGIPLKGLRQMEVHVNISEATEVTFTIVCSLGDVPNKISP